MSDIVIRVEGLAKRYRLGRAERHGTLRDRLAAALRPRSGAAPGGEEGQIWALDGVSFEVGRGEVVGVIGRNGAGKSTLLKILSRITRPTRGRVAIRGRVGSLLEVGTGFHPELSGRENIFLNGAILGMPREEIRRKFDAIVAFAEVERFIDTPVKHYSSGMYMRLAFAVAAHLEPEILIVDEVLAVGDAAFQKKCLGKMGEVSREGRTVLFVSHQLAAVEGLCGRCIVLDRGKVDLIAPPPRAISHYMGKTPQSSSLRDPEIRRNGSGRARFTDFYVEDRHGARTTVVRSGQDLQFVFAYEGRDATPLTNVSVGFGLTSEYGQALTVLYSEYCHAPFESLPPRGVVRCAVRRFPFAPGRYGVGVRLLVNGGEADWPLEPVATLDVEGGDFYGTGSLGWHEGRAPLLLDGDWAWGPR